MGRGRPTGAPDPFVFGEVVSRRDLPRGVRVKVFRDGLVALMLGGLARSPYDSS